MELRPLSLLLLLLFLSISTTTHFFTLSEGRRVVDKGRRIQKSKKFQIIKYWDVIGQKVNQLDMDSNSQPYVSSPFTLPPFDSLPPYSQPDNNAPPYCSYPNPPQPPSVGGGVGGGGGGYIPSPSPPPPPYYYLPPVLPYQSPPPTPIYTFPPPPPYYYEPTPPTYGFVPNPNPPSPAYSYVPSPTPTVFVPSPPVFLPPIIYPPPSVPPPPNSAPNRALWCVAKPSVPDPIIQEAMNYACGTVADCNSILPNGACFEPNTLIAHASYAFNSYWQRTKVGGGTCEFGGTAMLVTVDPSYDGCHFIYT